MRVKFEPEVSRVPFTDVAPDTVTFEPRVVVPAFWVRVLKDSPTLIVSVPLAPNTTVEVPLFHTWLAAVDVQEPLTVIVEPFAVRVPRLPRTSPPDVRGRFEAPVVRTVFPVGVAAVFTTVRVPAIRRPFVAIV